jgi:integrase/recombinase XerC/integrase/recombinase XerD
MADRTSMALRREKMNTSLYTLIDLFAATKRTEGRSPKTIDWYCDFLRKFAKYLGENPTISHVTLDNARSFVAFLQGQTTRWNGHPLIPAQEGGFSPYTIHGYVRTLKAFASWLVEEGFTGTDVFAKLKRPKLPQPMIEILSDDEIAALLKEINPRCFFGARLYATFLLLLDTGIRARELCTLTVDNVFLDQDYIKVLGKGRKERIVPFCAATKKALIRYIETWRPEPAHEQVRELFLSADGEPLEYNGLLQSIKRLGKSAGVPRLHPHLFRHTFAVKYLMNGADVMTLKMILGHSTLEVTQVYMHLAEAHVQVQHSKFSPVDRLDLKVGKRKRTRAGL